MKRRGSLQRADSLQIMFSGVARASRGACRIRSLPINSCFSFLMQHSLFQRRIGDMRSTCGACKSQMGRACHELVEFICNGLLVSTSQCFSNYEPCGGRHVNLTRSDNCGSTLTIPDSRHTCDNFTGQLTRSWVQGKHMWTLRYPSCACKWHETVAPCPDAVTRGTQSSEVLAVESMMRSIMLHSPVTFPDSDSACNYRRDACRFDLQVPATECRPVIQGHALFWTLV